jgi:hypothetical protein
MFHLPASTIVGKKIPLTTFYQNLPDSGREEQVCIDEVEEIIWLHTLSPKTIAISPGELVKELEIFEIKLHQKRISTTILNLIEKVIPNHILYLLSWKNEAQVVIGYKENNSPAGDQDNVSRYHYSDWMPRDLIDPTFSGLSLDTMYDSLVRQFLADEQPQVKSLNETSLLQREIDTQIQICEILEKKVKNERQYKIQVPLNRQLRKERQKLETLLASSDT